jgi:hypothetical protein
MRPIAAALLILPLSGCSVAALMQTDSLDKRMTNLENRIHDVEVRQAVASAASTHQP